MSASHLAYSLRALGKRDLPDRIEVAGRAYVREKTIKHDFYAATGFYHAADDPSDRAVLKMGRTEEYAGFPLKWLGRWLRDRELRFYRALADVQNVPEVLGTVGETGFVHRFVPGRPLEKGKSVPDTFFGELQSLMKQLHTRGIAYVDTNKPQNILLGDDQRPHLIDFQISFDGRELWPKWLARLVLNRLMKEDDYHILKHKRRMRPDQLTSDEQESAHDMSWFIRVHRMISKPYQLIRKRTFKRLRDSGQLLPEGSK